MLRRSVLLALFPVFVFATSAMSQDGSGVGLRLVPSVGYASASFGDNSPRSSSGFAFALGGTALFPVSSSTDITIELTWRPTKLDNPYFDESYTSVYLMAGVEFGGSVYFRPALGVDLQHFSGAFAADDGAAPAIALAVGTERRIGAGPWHLAPEGSARLSVTSGLSSFVLLFSVGVGWRS